MMPQDGWKNAIIDGCSTTAFENLEIDTSLLHTLTVLGLLFFFQTSSNNCHSHKNVFTVTHHLLFLTQFYTPVSSIQNCKVNIPEKTKVRLSASPIRMSDFTSPLTISNVGFSRTTYLKLVPPKQNSTDVYQYIFALKPSCHKTETSLVRESSVLSTINTSTPVKCDINHATQTNLDTNIEEKHPYQYYTHTAYSSVSQTEHLQYSNLSPTFTHTLNPQTVSPAKYNFCEFTNDCAGTNLDNSKLLRPFFQLFSSHMIGGRRRTYSENGCWKENKIKNSKYLWHHIPGSISNFDSKKSKAKDLDGAQVNKTKGSYTRQPANTMDLQFFSYVIPWGHKVNIDKCNKLLNQYANDQKIINASSVIDKHIIEFKTSQIRTKPHLVTNVRSKYSAYCRLCETRSYKSSVEQTHTILPTFTNLDFPEPQTRTRDSGKRCEFCDLYKMNSGDSFTDNSLLINNSVLSILPTLPPDIFPEPSTTYSVQSTQVPYIYSYEVTIDRAVYHRHTWTKEKVTRSAFPLLTSEATTLLSGLSRVQKSLYLESSIRSLPDVTVRSTDLHSAVTPHFSDKIS
ncbi:uncharacterized protein [Palaemon carinicauda]|uniref:uncharacterized protein n=1 Tax=Palaemon carinicauda TaxID=392227 RepID=UPI0035B66E8F